ncbi:MAG: WecB/TagA/CpsF family glycosyltransferase [Pseudomonadota bacterium]|nr:WecB/TagA/CpsF family glycosyltransferase [Pseudomonadota bacterium]
MIADVTAARRGQLARPRVVTSANGAVIARYWSDRSFANVLDAADIIDADGMSLVFASRLFCKNALSERAATTDFLLDAAHVAAKNDIRFFFLGGRRGIAARAAEHLRSRIPGLQVAGTYHGYFSPEQLPAICAAVQKSGADVLWLGMGSPLQERLSLECREMLPGLAWIRTCGGLFDHYGGGVSRAPDWMQRTGFEWLYRVAREPLRLGWRYLVTSPVAIYHLLTKTHD